MSFSDKLRIDEIITKEPENIEDWLQRFIEIILKENSDCNSKDKNRQRHYEEKEKEALAKKKKKEKNNGTT